MAKQVGLRTRTYRQGPEPDPLARRVGHLAGSIELPEPKSPLQRRLKERNWRTEPEILMLSWLIDTGPLVAFFDRGTRRTKL
jgi:hypothetical protein